MKPKKIIKKYKYAKKFLSTISSTAIAISLSLILADFREKERYFGEVEVKKKSNQFCGIFQRERDSLADREGNWCKMK